MKKSFTAGNSFDFSGQIKILDRGQSVVDLTGWTGASQIRDSDDVLIADLVFEWIDATTSLARVYFNGTTETWKEQLVFIDILMTSPAGIKVSTGVSSFVIERGITNV